MDTPKLSTNLEFAGIDNRNDESLKQAIQVCQNITEALIQTNGYIEDAATVLVLS